VIASFQNPYTTLGVGSAADEKEIKRAYRKAALQWHPDVSKQPEAESVFLKLTEAYEFLLGKINGKEINHSEHAQGSQAGNWDFHDWSVE
jgi:DnaJ-class molecular chaperone